MTSQETRTKKGSDHRVRSNPTTHSELVERVGLAVRKMGAQSVITSRTVADRFGMHMTDLEVLDLIFLRGELAAGELAEATGLTSGSVTAVIDRLVHAGYVERCADRRDRRKVLVRARHENIEAMKATYMSMQERMFTLWSTFDAQDLEVIADFLPRSTELAVTCCKEISQESPPSPKRRRGGACAAPVKRRKLRKRRQDGNRYCRPISQMRRHAPISRLVLQGEI